MSHYRHYKELIKELNDLIARTENLQVFETE